MFGNNVDTNAILSLLGQLGLGQNANTGMNPQMMRGQILMSKLIQQTQSQKPMQQVMAQKAALPMPAPQKRKFNCETCGKVGVHKQRCKTNGNTTICIGCYTKLPKTKRKEFKNLPVANLKINATGDLMENLQKVMALVNSAGGVAQFNQQMAANGSNEEIKELKNQIQELKELMKNG